MSALLNQLNARRRADGLEALALDERLCAVARAHAKDMLARGYFDNDTPEGLTLFDRMNEAAWHFQYAAENLALAVDEPTAERVSYASPAQRENTLDPHFRRVGIAALQMSMGEMFVEDFSD